MKQCNVRLVMKNQCCLAFLSLFLGCFTLVQGASIDEPSTIFYGKVIGVGDAQPFLIQEGALHWVIQNANGSNIVFDAELFPLNNGEFSYRLDIPHSAVAYELDAPDDGIPLPPVCETNHHVSASVDGVSAEFIGPGGPMFSAGQILRAQSYRMDMTVDVKGTDSDGDGLPDWWEDLMGLDKQSPDDAALDSDEDGVPNDDEYLAGTDPFHDDRTPSILDTELLVFPECITGVRLRAVDSDSEPDALSYTMLSTPANGVLALRNGQENVDDSDLVLTNGALFTQQDVNDGRLVFIHEDGSSVEPDSFSVLLTDGNSVAESVVTLEFYSVPENVSLLAMSEQQRSRAYLTASKGGIVLWDAVKTLSGVELAAPSSGMSPAAYAAEWLPKYGSEFSQVMTGGRGDDVLTGGMVSDVLVGGVGADTLVGGGGADLFMFDLDDDANDVIADFKPEEGDRINLSGLLSERRGMVHESLKFIISGTNTLIGLNINETDTGFTNQVLTLAGVTIDAMAGYELLLDHTIVVEGLRLQPCISVSATDSAASENGDNSGVFTLVRKGDLSAAFDVLFTIGGSAQNGSDYSSVGSSVRFESGQSEAMVVISPFADALVEPDEVVEIVLQTSDAYFLGAQAQALLTIKDLQAVVGLEVLQAKGSVNPAIPAMMLVTRNGQTASSLFVRLKIGGQAMNGVDYQYVAPYVSFAAGQTTALVSMTPLSGAVLSGGVESVSVEILEDSAYALADTASANMVLVDLLDTLSGWKARVAPDDASLSIAEFAAKEAGRPGLDNLRCYAFGINPDAPELDRLPKVVFRDGRMHVDIHKNMMATDVSFVVETSEDLASWSSSESMIREVSVPELGDQPDVVTYEAVSPVSSTPNRYVRVRVTYGD